MHVHTCFPQYKNLVNCVDSSLFKRKLCKPYVLDYVECTTKSKMVSSSDRRCNAI
jgi:hypothetical protein